MAHAMRAVLLAKATAGCALFRRGCGHGGEVRRPDRRAARRRARLRWLGHLCQRRPSQGPAHQFVGGARRRDDGDCRQYGRCLARNGRCRNHRVRPHGAHERRWRHRPRTATVVLLAGGALKGGRVVADWPGLKDADLYRHRDLTPTTDLRAVLNGLLKDHLGVSEPALAAQVFPGSGGVPPMPGLVA
jgi:hypothetical protein